MRAGIKMRESLQRAPSNHQFQAKQTRAHTHTHSIAMFIMRDKSLYLHLIG